MAFVNCRIPRYRPMKPVVGKILSSAGALPGFPEKSPENREMSFRVFSMGGPFADRASGMSTPCFRISGKGHGMPTVFPDVDFIFCPADGLLSASGRATTPHDPITRGIPRMVFGRSVHIFGVEFVRRQSRYGSQPVLAGGEYFMAVPQKSPKRKIGREEKSKREKRYCGENGGREETGKKGKEGAFQKNRWEGRLFCNT